MHDLDRDMFGHAIIPDEKISGPRKRSEPKPHGYAWTPGTGPEGETCKTCKHIARIRMSKTYLKCGLNRSNWTHGPGSDIRAGSPACKKWEAAI